MMNTVLLVAYGVGLRAPEVVQRVEEISVPASAKQHKRGKNEPPDRESPSPDREMPFMVDKSFGVDDVIAKILST